MHLLKIFKHFLLIMYNFAFKIIYFEIITGSQDTVKIRAVQYTFHSVSLNGCSLPNYRML